MTCSQYWHKYYGYDAADSFAKQSTKHSLLSLETCNSTKTFAPPMQEHVVMTSHISLQNVCDTGFILCIETSTNIWMSGLSSFIFQQPGWFVVLSHCSWVSSLEFLPKVLPALWLLPGTCARTSLSCGVKLIRAGHQRNANMRFLRYELTVCTMYFGYVKKCLTPTWQKNMYNCN